MVSESDAGTPQFFWLSRTPVRSCLSLSGVTLSSPMSQSDIYQLRAEGLEPLGEQTVSGMRHHSEHLCDIVSVAQS